MGTYPWPQALSRSQRELARFLREVVLPRFSKFKAPPRTIAPGDQLELAWQLSNFGSSMPPEAWMHVAMLDAELVNMRVRRSSGAPTGGEFELHHDFLPLAPPARVGMALSIEWRGPGR